MKIFIIGASGRVGKEISKILAEQGHIVYAGARNANNVLEHKNIIPVTIDLHEDIEKITDAYRDAEIVYFTAGTNGSDLFQTEAYGAVKAIKAAENKKIKRYIQLSGFFATRPQFWNLPEVKGMKNYYISKFFADHWLMDNSNLAYTIIQPSRLLEIKAVGKVQLNVENLGSISIGDVAQVMVDILNYPSTINKIITMSSGDKKISQALNEFDSIGE